MRVKKRKMEIGGLYLSNNFFFLFLFYFLPRCLLRNHKFILLKIFDILQLVLNSMHKYQPRIHLVKRPDSGAKDPIEDLDREPHKTFVFPEAIFTAVTAYQNQLVSFIYTPTFNSPSFSLLSLSLSTYISATVVPRSFHFVLFLFSFHSPHSNLYYILDMY